MRLKHYQKIEGCNFSKIECNYLLGGMNYFTGDHERRGIFIHFTKVEKTKDSECFGLFNDFSYKIFVKELKRKSQKQIDNIWDKFFENDNFEKLHDLHIKGKRNELITLLSNITQKINIPKDFLKKELKVKNECAKTVSRENAYEIWQSHDKTWIWYVLKKWQLDDNKQYARWFCDVVTPICPEGEMGDVYVKEIKENATRIK